MQDELIAASQYITSLYINKDNFGGKEVPLPYDTVAGVPCAKYMLAPKTEKTEAIDDELRIVSNAEYIFAPLYHNNETMDNLYLGTYTGISYRYSAYDVYNESYDPRERDWYKKAMDTPGVPVWVDTYIDAYGEICVTNAITFTDDTGEIRGVIATDILLKQMKIDIISMKIGETGHAFLADNHGEIIAHPLYDGMPESLPKGNYRDILQEELTRNDETGKTSGLTKAEINDKQNYIAFEQLPTVSWTLAVAAEIDEIIAPAVNTKEHIDFYIAESQIYMKTTLINVLIRLVVVLAMSAIVILVASYLISRTITTPIKVLVLNVKKIGNGNLDIKIEENGKDEVAELAATFNKMTVDLKAYIENLSQITAEKERIGAELGVATRIQASMLPSIFPAFPQRPEFDIYATMLPAKEVGGDFYDFYIVDEKTLCIVIADVSGKGVPAALFMVIAKTLIKNNVQLGKSPKEVFETVNNQLCEGNSENMFVTAFMGIYETDTGKITYVNAGHNLPLIKRKGKNFEWLKSNKSLVLAGMEDIKYSQQEIILSSGDTLYLYTDGVTEAVNNEKKLFSDVKLIADINKYKDCNLVELLTFMKKEINNFADGAEQADDITMIGFTVK